ncbi:MAG: DUF309 domain-containing protein [Rhizobiales bacterium]|nr:DUF309 domain-containing protein [Hyphomicrobiales bacterium]
MARRVTSAPTEADWSSNHPYLYGHALLRAGFHWEAHEVWEAVWMASRPNSRERALVQGLIQVANAALKLSMGRLGAGKRLALLAADRFRDADPSGSKEPLLGVLVGPISKELASLAARIASQGSGTTETAADAGQILQALHDELTCIIMHNSAQVDAALHEVTAQIALPPAQQLHYNT